MAVYNTVLVDFPIPAASSLAVRDWFLEVEGRPEGYQPSAAMFSARHARAPQAPQPRAQFRLAGGIPNPFRHSTSILFELPERSDVQVEIFDLQGRKLRTLRSTLAAGEHRIVWDRRTEAGDLAPRGVYSARLTAGSNRATARLTVM